MNLGEVINTLRGTSPDSMMIGANAPDKWREISSAPILSDMISAIGKSADKFRNTPIPNLPYRYYRTFDISGSRQEYEVFYFGRRKRLNTFALLSLLQPDENNYAELSDIIWAVCDEYSWCLPAHMEGKSMNIITSRPEINKKGIFTGSMTDQKYMIDLFGAETGFALAEITTLLYDKLDPFLVYRARSLIFERIINPYLNANTDRRGWENGTANWTAVCAGSVGAAALYLIDEPMLLGRIVYRVMNSMETFINGYGEDGACLEGLAYWNYGFGFFVYFADLLKARTNGKIDLLNGSKAEKIHKIMTFQQKCFLNGRVAVSFSDAPRENWFSPGLTHYIKRLNSDVKIPTAVCMAVFGDDGCHRWASDFRNLLWTDLTAEPDAFDADSFEVLENAGWVIIKQGCFSFACKGGHNGEPHNHNDVGSFMLNINGDTFLADVGVGMHSRQYFGKERYTFFPASSRGHSLPIINGQFQKEGREYNATEFKAERRSDADTITYNIGAAYGDENIISVQRKFRVENSTHSVTLQDSFAFKKAPDSLVERLVTMLPPEDIGNGTVLIKGIKGAVKVNYDSAQWNLAISSEKFKPSRDSENIAYCIDFEAKQSDTENIFKVGISVSD